MLCEIAIVACDLAEVLGAAIGLHLLFGITPGDRRIAYRPRYGAGAVVLPVREIRLIEALILLLYCSDDGMFRRGAVVRQAGVA